MSKKDVKLLFLPGDGIGPEVLKEVTKIANWFNRHTHLNFVHDEGLIGGVALDKYDTPLPDETKKKADQADAVMFGTVGGPQYDHLPFTKRPEQGLLDLRKHMGLYANLRPAHTFDSLTDSSALKLEKVRGLDILMIRELVGGVYHGEPRGIGYSPKQGRKGYNTICYSEDEVRRIATVAFEAAQRGNKRLCAVDRANLLESMQVWRDTVNNVAKLYPDVEFSNVYVDNVAMELVTNPTHFDLILTPNLLGDVLSDLAGALTGSMGLLPSASIGNKKESGFPSALYEPVHSSQPDIAGKGIANPLAALSCFAMLLKHSLDETDLALKLRVAIRNVVDNGARTADFARNGEPALKTAKIGDLLVKELDRITAAEKGTGTFG